MYVLKRGILPVSNMATLTGISFTFENTIIAVFMTWALIDWCADGRKERVQFDKITARVSRLCYGLDSEHVDAASITQKVISGVYQGVTTIELDNLVCRYSGQRWGWVGAEAKYSTGCRNCRLYDRYPSGLCYPRSPYRRQQPPQADEEDVLPGHQRPLPLCKPRRFTHASSLGHVLTQRLEKRSTLPNDQRTDV